MSDKITSRAAFVVSVSLLLITLAVNISMPLFRVYAMKEGFNNTETSLVLAAYILGMLPCYIFLGGISDRVGRKPVMITSLLCALCSTIIITAWPNVHSLIAARIFQGVALGLSMGCGTAYISELLRHYPGAATRAANMASLSTSIGFGGGALISTIALIIHFTLVPITYYLLIALTLAGLAFSFSLPALRPPGGGLVRLPFFPKGSFGVNLAILVCWAANGVVIAIIPGQLAKFDLTIYAGFCLVLINWSGALLQPFIRKMDAVVSVRLGFLLIPAGFALVVVGCYIGQLACILIGSMVMGIAAYGFSYMGGLNIISNLGGDQKARAVSGYMLFGYIGFGIPAIFLGLIADRYGIVNALLFFEAAIILISIYLFITFRRKTS